MADELSFSLVDETSLTDVPQPAAPGSRCQTCDYWERLDGRREAPGAEAPDADARQRLKVSRLMAGTKLGGSYGMLAYRAGPGGDRQEVVGWAQFGPISVYPRAQTIRDRYPELPDSPAPWVITCLQVRAELPAREAAGRALLAAVCDELDRRGVSIVEAYPEVVTDLWRPSPGPASIYEQGGFERAADDERWPVYRRELTGAADEAWPDELLRGARTDDDDDAWPLPLPKQPDADDFFRLPPDRPKRPNPFGDD